MSEKNKKEVSRSFKGIWIPKEIYLAEGLSALEIILWSEINSLECEEKGGCFASNDYLMKFLGINKTRLGEILSKLKELNLLIQIKFDGTERILKTLLPSKANTSKKPAYRKSGSLSTAKEGSCIPEKRTPVLKPSITIEQSRDTTTEVVVFSDLKISESLKSSLMKKYEQRELEIAVKRVKAWEGRSNDEAALLTCLERRNEWNDDSLETPEHNRLWAHNLKPYQNEFVRFEIFNKCVEFTFLGSAKEPLAIEYDMKGFKNKVNELLKKYGFT